MYFSKFVSMYVCTCKCMCNTMCLSVFVKLYTEEALPDCWWLIWTYSGQTATLQYMEQWPRRLQLLFYSIVQAPSGSSWHMGDQTCCSHRIFLPHLAWSLEWQRGAVGPWLGSEELARCTNASALRWGKSQPLPASLVPSLTIAVPWIKSPDIFLHGQCGQMHYQSARRPMCLHPTSLPNGEWTSND